MLDYKDPLTNPVNCKTSLNEFKIVVPSENETENVKKDTNPRQPTN